MASEITAAEARKELARRELARRREGSVPGRDGKGWFEKLDAGVRGVADIATIGLSDEFAAGMGALTGIGGTFGDYRGNLARQQAIDEFDERHNTAARLTGQIAGGIGLGAGMAARGLTLAGRTGASTLGRAGGAAAEGGLFGAAYGAGSADDGNRLKGAATGAALGAATGGVVGGAFGARANQAARQAAERAAPTADDLAAQSKALYDGMRASGLRARPEFVDRLRQNVAFALRGTDERLAGEAFGIMRVMERYGDDLADIETLHNLSKQINRVRRGLSREAAQGEQGHYLDSIKTILDSAMDRMTVRDVTGADPKSTVAAWREADRLWGRVRKSRLVDSIMDSADVRAGQYTQSGMANAIKTEMRQLYRNKKALRQFSPDEQRLIRQMAMGGSQSQIVNLFARFAPRGPVSAAAGSFVGSSTLGPAGFIIGPALGEGAAAVADRSAARAMDHLRLAAITGNAGIPRAAIPSRYSNLPVIPTTGHTTGLAQQ